MIGAWSLVWPVGTGAATTCVSCGKIIQAELRFCCECHEGERLVGVPAEPPSAAEKQWNKAMEASHRDSSKFTLSDLRAQLAILKAKADRVREADLQAAIAKVEAPRADKPQSKHGRGTIHMGGADKPQAAVGAAGTASRGPIASRRSRVNASVERDRGTIHGEWQKGPSP